MAKYNHQKSLGTNSVLREVVFGMEDGMVSTLGALTGVAVGTNEHFTVLLTGTVVISVEAVSMAIGSYLSNKSQEEADERKIAEEKEEIDESPEEEQRELQKMFVRDGWPKDLSMKMSQAALKNKKLMLKDMSYREHGIFQDKNSNSIVKSIGMFCSYVVGGAVPFVAYFFIPVSQAIKVSVTVTFLGLFVLGIIVSRYTNKSWIRTGLRTLLLGSLAFFIGYFIGELANIIK